MIILHRDVPAVRIPAAIRTIVMHVQPTVVIMEHRVVEMQHRVVETHATALVCDSICPHSEGSE